MFIKIDIAQVGVGVNTHRSSVVTVIKKPCHFVVSFAGRDFGTSSGAKVYHPLKGRRDIPLTASSLTSDSISSHEALASMLGYGFVLKINPETGKSELWVDGVHARDFFETLEMRYRKMIVSGEELVVNNGGVVSEVLPAGETFLTSTAEEFVVSQDDEKIIWPLAAGDERLTFVVKGEAGIDYQMFVEDDILRYTWRDKDTGMKGASGYLLVRSAVNEFTYTADILEGSPEWLKEGMTLALFGNLTNKERQGFIVLSARERTIAIYDGVNSVRITPDNLKVLLGNLSGVVDPDFPELQQTKGGGLYCSHGFFKGTFVLRSGKRVETELSNLSRDITLAETSIVANTTMISDVDSKLLTMQAEVALKASVSDIDSVTGRVNTAEASITVQAQKVLNLETGQTDMQSSIKLKADLIELDAYVLSTGLFESTGMIKAELIDADKLKVNTLYSNVGYNKKIQVGGSIKGSLGQDVSICGIAGNPTYATSSGELSFRSDFFLGFEDDNVNDPLLTFGDVAQYYRYIKMTKEGLQVVKKGITTAQLTYSKLLLSSENSTNSISFTANNTDADLRIKGLPIKGGIRGDWGQLYLDKSTGQIYVT